MSMQPEPKPHAPAAAERLAAAEASLAQLETEIGPLALAASEGESSASKKLAALEERISIARREVQKLEAAHRHAILIDRRNDAAAAAKMRHEQLAIFEASAAARIAAMTEVLDLIGKAAKAYDRYVTETQKMVIAVPTGTHLPVMALGDGSGGSWLGDGDVLIGREAYRMAGVARLPFARAPALSDGHNAGAISPGSGLLADAQQAALREIKGQISRIDQADMRSATTLQEAS